ncbi:MULTISPECIES: IspD/TarI family cytidylyltransferase [Mycolicibacterium]|uniref:4-diphosphocytidyl-2C-methyl-D-erythritol synthase n=2 Tax=Mycolicibacterium TaxID=1866885 RepID=A1TCK7_MYCVP|nr:MULTISPECIES: 2-C-methyl-D-erythritol 4-phosphate cytidylyltransferase [Mycolicibacterium]ABM14907.1 4-diphosphocytidyl-2C-methyl-D-erythritol synthase [Mycolicibacterium vanbaalenii PYR-1]MCV7130590.1 2-C-methyl-D-erythritol 4-phosphate cytidylyltransferase [Mycolicibacterium vanbaalenii PYR-1]MDN4521942.1 2-C-methyl-D-erythritol 4-phosphate cytidylyltransferase [Mycolicibacterium austroafricanum]MDW5611165.1 2-C-methyl-D-erythritol 4-phosphate cytidylyltransferase [Mycolicibacterium sp. D5
MTVTAILPVPESYVQRREAVFAPVAGESPLVRIVRALAAVGDVVVAAAQSLADEVRETLAAQALPAVRTVGARSPGARADCIAAGLAALGDGDGPVLLHDLTWPLIADATLDAVLSAVHGGADAVLPIRPVTDSVKAVDARGAVTATLDRSPLRTVQFPRGFDAAVLERLLADGAADFDELGAALSVGTPLTLVEGDTDTMSFDLPADSAFLAAVIAGR